MQNLPVEIRYQIFAQLQTGDKKSLSQVCKRFYDDINPLLWKSICFTSDMVLRETIPSTVLENINNHTNELSMNCQSGYSDESQHDRSSNNILSILKFSSVQKMKKLTYSGHLNTSDISTVCGIDGEFSDDDFTLSESDFGNELDYQLTRLKATRIRLFDDKSWN